MKNLTLGTLLMLAVLTLPSYADAATLYFNAASDTSWTNVSNWWTDPAFTVQASGIPGSADDVVISANVMSCAGTPTVRNLIATSSAAVYIPIIVTGNASFHGTGGLPGRIYGTTTFYDTTSNGFFADIGSFIGNYIFNDSSSNEGVVNGSAVFNGSSTNAGRVTGNADVYYPSPNPIGGTVVGTVSYHGYSVPTVLATPALSIGTSTATLPGIVTSTGGSAITSEGFNYGTSTAYGLTATVSGPYLSDSFSSDVSGLAPESIYHFQAFAENSEGMSTSSDMILATLIVPVADPLGGRGTLYNNGLTPVFWNTVHDSAASSVQRGTSTADSNSSSSLPVSAAYQEKGTAISAASSMAAPAQSAGTSPLASLRSSSSAHDFLKNLSYRDQGADVLGLQQFLSSHGFLSAVPNGYFGPSTRAALAGFQKARGIRPAAGNFGPVTRAAVNSMFLVSVNRS